MNPFMNFVRLARFSGREPRRQFWPYVGVVLAFFFFVFPVIVMLTVLPVITEAITASAAPNAAAGAAASSDAADAAANHVFNLMFALIIGEVVLMIVLLAAAIARRLRDGGLSARWGFLPVPFILCSSVLFWMLFATFTGPEASASTMALFAGAFASNMAYLASLVVLIVLLCRPTRTPDTAPAPA